jgi:hypothetical protein
MAKTEYKAQVFEEKFFRSGGGVIVHRNSGKKMEFKDYFSLIEKEEILGWKAGILREVEEAKAKAKEAGAI